MSVNLKCLLLSVIVILTIIYTSSNSFINFDPNFMPIVSAQSLPLPLPLPSLSSDKAEIQQFSSNEFDANKQLQVSQTETELKGFFQGEYHRVLVPHSGTCGFGNTIDGTVAGTLSSSDGIHYSPTGTWQVSFAFVGLDSNCLPVSHFYSGPAATNLQSGASHIVLAFPLGFLTYDPDLKTFSGYIVAFDEEEGVGSIQLQIPSASFGGPIVGSDAGGEASSSWIFTPVQPEVEISVETSGDLNPQPTKKNASPLSGDITIRTYNPINGEPVPLKNLQVKTCTEKGSIDTDGHIHDQGTNDPCFKSTRPHSSLTWVCCAESGGIFPQPSGNPINVITDSNGIAKISYTPPSSTDAKNRYYIAGQDKIIVTLTSDPSIKNDQESIVTRVNGLEQMIGSNNPNVCLNTNTFNGPFFFERQSNHGCIFYGTSSTNDALLRIANDFVQKQIDCRNSPNNQCTIIDDKGKQKIITINGEPIPIKITAMNLPWGGLSDIGGNWNPPHKSHYSGKEVDIGFGNLKLANGQFNMDLIHLLRYVSSIDPNFKSFVPDEGGDIAQTMAKKPPHIHINFLN